MPGPGGKLAAGICRSGAEFMRGREFLPFAVRYPPGRAQSATVEMLKLIAEYEVTCRA